VAAGGSWYMRRLYINRLQQEEKEEAYWTSRWDMTLKNVVDQVQTQCGCTRLHCIKATDMQHFVKSSFAYSALGSWISY
jgi:hypothetical protein